MGWVVGAYKGQPLISHSGGTCGFSSEVAFLPAADLAIVILSNDGAVGGLFVLAVQFRLLELLFAQPEEFDLILSQILDRQAQQVAQLQNRLGHVDPEAVAPYLGRYANPDLGEIDLRLEGAKLVFDAGEIRSELRPVQDEAGQVTAYALTDAPLTSTLAPVTLRIGADGGPEVEAPAKEGGGYVFTLLEASAGAALANEYASPNR
jgi:hypothetical protein